MPTKPMDRKKWHRSASLRANDDRFRVVVDAINEGIFISDATTGRFIEANRAGQAMVGYTMDELIGADIGSISSGVYPYTQETAIEYARKATTLATDESQPFEWHCRAKGGRLFWAEISISYANIDNVPFIVAVMHDISERKQLLEDLKLALADASAASEAKTCFLATVSHELRTPLNAIIGFSEIMLAEIFGPISARYLDYTNDIHSSGEHLLSLINDVLDFSRLDSERDRFRDQVFSLNALIEDSVRLVTAQAAKAQVSINCQFGADLPLVRADMRRIKQVVLNILSNALTFTPPHGLVTIATKLTSDGIAIQIADTGIGIAAEDISKVFERFGQVDSTLARKYEGTGLGLPLARRLTELHGGSLTLQSILGVGTTVTITLPAERLTKPLEPLPDLENRSHLAIVRN